MPRLCRLPLVGELPIHLANLVSYLTNRPLGLLEGGATAGGTLNHAAIDPEQLQETSFSPRILSTKLTHKVRPVLALTAN